MYLVRAICGKNNYFLNDRLPKEGCNHFFKILYKPLKSQNCFLYNHFVIKFYIINIKNSHLLYKIKSLMAVSKMSLKTFNI